MKNMIKDLLDKGIGSMNPEKREKTLHLLESMCNKVKELDPEWMVKNQLKTHEILEGPHFNEEYSEMLIKGMKNVDGTTGAHYSLRKAEEYMNGFTTASTLSESERKYNLYDWWYIINMLYSDYQGTLGNKDEIYIALARDYFEGPDEEAGKAWYQNKYKLKKLIGG